MELQELGFLQNPMSCDGAQIFALWSVEGLALHGSGMEFPGLVLSSHCRNQIAQIPQEYLSLMVFFWPLRG